MKPARGRCRPARVANGAAPTHEGARSVFVQDVSHPMTPVRLVAGLVLALSACSSPPADPPPAAPAPVVDVVDGFYRGTSTRFQARSRSCPRPGLVSLQLWDRKFQYRWNYSTYVDAEVLPDGTVTGQGPGITLLGRFEADKINGDITNGDCGLHFTVTRKD